MTVRLAILAAALVAAASPVAAQPADTATRRVPTADLDLARPAGIATLDRRLAAAARALCQPGSRTLADRATTRQCTADALASAAPARQARIAAAQARDVQLAGF